MDHPRLRAVEMTPILVDGEQRYHIADPLELAEDGALVAQPAAAIIATLLDGSRSPEEVQSAFVLRGGALVSSRAVREVIAALDRSYLLDNARSRRRLSEARSAFAKKEVRDSALAGAAYPAEADALRALLDSFRRAPGGAEAPDAPLRPEPEGEIGGVIAPHIDYRRGGPCYTWAYREAAESGADLFVILGLDHKGAAETFALTRKDFVTPLGRATTDQRFIDLLTRRVEGDLFAGELAHRAEHSVELQVVFLQHALAGRRFTVVPLLCGGFHRFILEKQSPAADAFVASVVRALRDAAREHGGRVCFVIGADLAHVGARFGTEQPMTPEFLSTLRAHDTRLLERVAAADHESFVSDLAATGNQHSVCSVANIYTGLAAAGCGRGRVLRYDQAVDREENSTVTFAAAALYRVPSSVGAAGPRGSEP
ncbi:MAG: AmmeMemoRadiSam system protein B [Planctomycetes bacterium]|nr:AmmeMemoRadiSam system protein B [Planctomycetota bacterium]